MDIMAIEDTTETVETIIQQLNDGNCSREKAKTLYKQGISLIENENERVSDGDGSISVIGETVNLSSN